MARPNHHLLAIPLAHHVQREAHGKSEEELLNELLLVIPNEEELRLNALFQNTLKWIVLGNAFRLRIIHRAGLSSFGPALNALNDYDFLTQQTRRQLCIKMSELKTVLVHWQTIVHNLTHPAMIHVDARKLSSYELSRSISYSWVKNYNDSHNPQRRRRRNVVPEYPEEMINTIMAGIVESGIIEYVNGDPEQLQLIGEDLTNEMLNLNNE